MVTFDTDAIVCATVGGLLLGLATSINYIIRGKVTGMSGIFYGIISLNKCTQYVYHSLTSIKIKYSWRNVLYFGHIFPCFWI